MKKMSPETFLKEYPELIIAYKKLEMLHVKGNAQWKIQRVIERYEEHC